MADHKTRRVKILRINPEWVIGMLNGRRHECVHLPVCEAIPEGTQVLQVRESWERRCFELLITHESFPEIPDNTDIPDALGGAVQYEAFRRVPSPFISAEEYRDFIDSDRRSEVNRAIYRQAEKLVEAMVSEPHRDESPQFAALRQRLITGLAKASPSVWRNPAKVDVVGQLREMNERVLGVDRLAQNPDDAKAAERDFFFGTSSPQGGSAGKSA